MELTHGSDTVEKAVSGLKLQGQKVGGLLLWHCREAPETIEDAFTVPVFMLDDKNKLIDMHWVDFASKEFIGTPFAIYFPSGKIRWGSINLFSYEGREVFFLVLRLKCQEDSTASICLLQIVMRMKLRILISNLMHFLSLCSSWIKRGAF